MKGLTCRQRELLDYIEAYTAKRRYSPTYREIMEHFSFSSPGTVYRHLQALKRKGALNSKLTTNQATSKETSMQIPLIGTVRAGFPIETFETSRLITTPDGLIEDPAGVYALTVKDRSFVDELISKDDTLFVNTRRTVQENDQILVVIGHHETFIKEYHRIENYISLNSHNPNLQPVIVRDSDIDIDIHGIIIGLIREY